MAPTPTATNGQSAPTANDLVLTATPNWPVSAQRAVIEKVMVRSFERRRRASIFARSPGGGGARPSLPLDGNGGEVDDVGRVGQIALDRLLERHRLQVVDDEDPGRVVGD